jgi:hypothetical protein
MRGAARFLEQTALVGVTMEWDEMGSSLKRTCCGWLQENVFRRFMTVHGLLPYGTFSDYGPPLNESRLCDAHNGLRRWHLLVWDHPRPMTQAPKL